MLENVQHFMGKLQFYSHKTVYILSRCLHFGNFYLQSFIYIVYQVILPDIYLCNIIFILEYVFSRHVSKQTLFLSISFYDFTCPVDILFWFNFNVLQLTSVNIPDLQPGISFT